MCKFITALFLFCVGSAIILLAMLVGKKLHNNRITTKQLEEGNRNARNTCERARKTNRELKQSIDRTKSIIKEIEKQHD